MSEPTKQPASQPQASPPQASPPQASHSPWAQVLISFRWPLVLIALALIPLVVYLETLRRAADAVPDFHRIAEGFRSGQITETFLSSIPTIDPLGSGNLELASFEVTEILTRSDERWAFWDLVPLGVTVSEVRVPVTYRYHLRLSDPWRLEVNDHTCIVYAPQIRPTLPPAIHTEGLQRRMDEGWLRFDGAEQMATLEKSITPRLRQMAGDSRRVALVREQSRKTVAEFVRNWLLMEQHWSDDRFRVVTVIFPDEELESPEQIGPTVILEEG